MNDRQKATVLAALRAWQELSDEQREAFDDIATDGGLHDSPLSIEEIDDLIEELQNS